MALAACAAIGCSDDARVITIEVTTGHETDTFTLDPPVLRVDVQARDAAGTVVAGAESAPGGSFALGETSLDQLLRFEVHGFDASGTARVGGRSLSVVIGEVQSEVFPVFAQRIGEWSRPPGELTHTHVGGLGGVVGERFLFVTGGQTVAGANPATLAFYDTLALGGSTGITLDRVPRSVVVSADGRAALFIDDEGADWVDFDVGITPAALPEGLGSFAEVAGGRTVDGPAASYVVGATRLDGASDAVLVVGADRSLAAARLKAARQGAAASWADDRLVIIGGSASDPGLEILLPESAAAQLLSFEPDAVEGAGAVADPGGTSLVVLCGTDEGTAAPPRSIDLRCASMCAPVALPFDLGATLVGCSSYRTPSHDVLVVGSDQADGATRAFLVAPGIGDVREVLLREPRRGAAVVPAPNGTLTLLGGQLLEGDAALRIESLFP